MNIEVQHTRQETQDMFCFQSMFRPNNMVAQSQSGTGKTAVFVLAMLSRVDATKHCTQVKFQSYLILIIIMIKKVREGNLKVIL